VTQPPLLRVLVADDEPAAREELKYLLTQAGGVEVVAEAVDGRTALDEALRWAPDVVFLDIHMPGADGLDVARRLADALPEARVVFATAHEGHAVEAFELSAADYLLKPFTLERVRRSLQRLRPPAAPASARLVVERRKGTHFLDLSEVLCVITDAGVVTVCAVDGTRYSSSRTLQELEDDWGGSDRLYRCHREALIHLRHVASLSPAASGTYRAILDDEARTEVPVSRNRVKGLKAALGL
jgi:DNA-binding LytR/AlgR family response regulator